MHSFKLFKNHHRQYLKISFCLFSFLILFCFGFNNLYAATYYVCTTGNDNNPGTEAKPFKTLQRAHTAVSAGDTVIVEDGVYTSHTSGTHNANLEISKKGNASNWITFKARNQHQAILDGNNYNVAYNIRLNRTCGFIRVEGFTLRRPWHSGVRAVSLTTDGQYAHDVEIINNKIHDIGQVVVNRLGIGIAGVFTGPLTRRALIEGNIIYDIGRLPGGTYPDGDSGHDYRHDHGWYAQGKNHTFRSNYVYNCKAGFGIKIDGHYSLDELAPSEFTHIIENNFFKPIPQQTVGGWVRPYNNRSTTTAYGQMKNPRWILDGNYFYGDPSGLGYPVRISAGGSSNFSGTVMQNNICSAKHLYEPHPDVIANITDINNTTDAPESMFPTAPESIFKIDISDPLTPPSINDLTIN